MKKIILFICMAVCGKQLLAQQMQSAFYDAQFLYNSCFDKEGGVFIHRVSLFDVMKKYYPAPVSEAELKNNPFFGKYLPDLVSQSAGERSVFSNGISFSSLGNLDVTTIADGFAKFIVERTKKELQAAFFDKFIRLIKKPEYKDVQTLFPVTYSVVLRLPEDVYNYEKYIQSLRNAFGKDMETILPHLEDVLKNGLVSDFFNDHFPELKSVCLTALYFGKELRQGTHIGEVLEKYDASGSDYKFSSPNTDTVKTNAIRFIQEVSRSMKGLSAEENEYWVPADSIKMLISNRVSFDIYLGLLYQKVKNIRVCNTSPVTYGDVMSKTNVHITKVENLVKNVTDQVEHTQSTLHDLMEKIKKDRTIDDYIAYFSAATRIIESFKENELIRGIINELPQASQADVEFYWKKYSDFIEGTNAVLNIYTSIKERNYSVAINSVRNLYEMRFDPALARDSVKNLVEKVIAFLLDKGAFIASVAEAKTSNEVREAINLAAMPLGSARVKRMSSFNVAVNAYCGIFGGYEKINKVDNDGFKFNSYGLTAPIGIAISKGTKKGWSHSIMISALDLGAVVAFRFSNDTTAQVPTIQLKNILAPGLIYSLGIPKTPLSVNFGAQVGPNLRKVTSTTNDYSNNTYIRYSLSFCVDLPLFNLYTKSR